MTEQYQDWTPADGSESDEHTTAEPAFYTVAVYLCDRAFGGREEGGWWYDTGMRCDEFVPVICATREQAYEVRNTLQATLDSGVNADGSNRDLGSVNCVGRFCAEVWDGYPDSHYPTHRPHYE
jgi:hypothetical protein